jgi:dipeptidyl-peptidase-4
MTSHKVTIGIYNPETQKTIYLNAGDPTDRYFTNISWAPDAKSLYLIELNRDQNHAELWQYNAETGERIYCCYEEEHPKYVEPQHPIIFLPWDNGKFIYQSQRDGYNHLYLFDIDVKSDVYKKNTTAGSTCTERTWMKQLTSGNWLVQDVLGFDEKKKEIIFTATKESPLQSNLYKVNVNNGKITQLDNGKGIHRGILSATGSYLIDNWSSPEVPRSINLMSTQNGKSINLLTAKDPFEGFTMPSIETGTIKAADGVTDLYYRLVKPADFDPAKKYPAIIYVYGGPHAQMVTGGWQNKARGWDIYMAGKGYIMFTLDNRGSENRGLEFENVTFRNLGIEEGKDQVKGAEFLKALPYVDANRIGVHGWSFGGHMTTALMLRYPEIFKVGVAGGPVIDWSYYEIMYGERYMDTPQSNPEGYKNGNLKNLAGNLKGHLLLIHDDHDDTCVPQHTLSFIKACVDARTYPDLFIYPTHKHNVMGRDRVHLHEKITRYFEDNL